MIKFKKIAQISIVTAAILMPVLALAQYTPIPLPTNPLNDPTAPTTGLTLVEIEQNINRIAFFLITVSVVIAVIFIIWGGIRFASAGDDTAKAESGKTIIKNGIIGALVIMAVGVIMQTLSEIIARNFFV